MSNVDIIRAWKDEEYRNGLSDSERSQLPANPAGMIELRDTDLTSAAGGSPITITVSFVWRRGCRGTSRSQRIGGRNCGTYTCTC